MDSLPPSYPRLEEAVDPILPPKNDLPEAERNWVGWGILAAIFLFLIVGGLMRSSDQKGVDLSTRTQDSQIKTAFSLSKGSAVTETASKDSLETASKALAAKGDARSKILRLQVDFELGRKLDERTTSLLASSKDPKEKAFADFYKDPKNKDLQSMLLKRIDRKDLTGQIAEIHISEARGEKGVRERLFPKSGMLIIGLLGLGVMGGAFLGCMVWTGYVYGKADGKIRILGLPGFPISLALADRYAWRGAGLMLIFIALQILMALSGEINPTLAQVTTIGSSVLMIFLALNLPKDSVFGHRLTSKHLGTDPDDLGVKIGWGLAGYVANIPLLLFSIAIMIPLSKVLPTHSHPAGDALADAPGMFTILKVLLAGVIAAPIWEEVMFRGLLFPALARLTNNVWVGALVSSLLFAAIHPQGPGGWLGLATIAMMNCALTYHTRSLIPAMVLHMVNNGVALVASLLIGRSL